MDDVHRALELIQRTDAVDRCLAKASAMVDSIISALDPLPASKYKDALLDLAGYVVRRER